MAYSRELVKSGGGGKTKNGCLTNHVLCAFVKGFCV